MGYVGVHGVAALHRYKYSGVDHSYLAKYVLQPFWGRFVNFFPLWMPYIHLAWIRLHPDGFTLLTDYFSSCIRLLTPLMVSKQDGQIHLVHWGSFLTMDVTHLPVRLRPWPLGALLCVEKILSGFGLYQPFRFMVQHGNRVSRFSLVRTKELVRFENVLALDNYYLFSGAANCGSCLFFKSYFTNTLILPVVNGPTEGLALIYFSHFFTTIVGAEWWAQHFGKSLPFLNWVPIISESPTYGAILFLMIAFAVIPTVSFNVYNAYKVVRARKGSMLLALAMLCPFCVLVGGVLLWDYLSPFNIMVNYPHMVVLGTGLAFGFLVGRMILAHLCDEPKGLKTNMCMSLLYLPFAIANTLTARLNNGIPLVEENWVLLGYCLYTAALYLHFATSVIHEITTALGIYCFRITRKEA